MLSTQNFIFLTLFCDYTMCFFIYVAMAPFYHATCAELRRPEDDTLLKELAEKNRVELSRLDHNIEDAQENLGETELKDALLERAEYLSKIGDKVGQLRYSLLLNFLFGRKRL